MKLCVLRAAAAAGAFAVAFGALAQAPAVMKIGTATLNPHRSNMQRRS